MKQIQKRIGSLLLSVFMALPMLPTTVFGASEAFSLPTGQTYYFDLSGEADHIGTINTALPDVTLHYVPFTYAGTIMRIVWIVRASTIQASQRMPLQATAIFLWLTMH